MTYLNRIVVKPWGYEFCQLDSGESAVWMLHIREGQWTSTHYHANKHTTLAVLLGRVRVMVDGRSHLLLPAESVSIKRGAHHSTFAIEDSWVMEIESPSNKEDLVRVHDVYGRRGKPYEGASQIVPMHPLAAFPATFPEVERLKLW